RCSGASPRGRVWSSFSPSIFLPISYESGEFTVAPLESALGRRPRLVAEFSQYLGRGGVRLSQLLRASRAWGCLGGRVDRPASECRLWRRGRLRCLPVLSPDAGDRGRR